MVKLHLTYVNRIEKTGKNGKPYISISIKANEYGDRFLSGFGNKDNAGWQAGQEVEVAEVKEVVKDGKTYLNFEMSKRPDMGEVLDRLEKLENGLIKLHLRLVALEPPVIHNVPGTNIPYPEMDVTNGGTDFTSQDVQEYTNEEFEQFAQM